MSLCLFHFKTILEIDLCLVFVLFSSMKHVFISLVFILYVLRQKRERIQHHYITCSNRVGPAWHDDIVSMICKIYLEFELARSSFLSFIRVKNFIYSFKSIKYIFRQCFPLTIFFLSSTYHNNLKIKKSNSKQEKIIFFKNIFKI